MSKDIYSRMAASELIHTHHYVTSNQPNRTFHVDFAYANGFACSYNGKEWKVVAVEYETAQAEWKEEDKQLAENQEILETEPSGAFTI